MKRDLYETLGVAKTADEKELRGRFPQTRDEVSPGQESLATPKPKRPSRRSAYAYEALKDPQKRAAYDRYGHAAFEQGGMGAGGAGLGSAGAGGFSDIFEDIFGEMMGGGRQRRSSGGRERGADLRYNMEISLEEAYAGEDGADPGADIDHLRRLHRLRRQARHQADRPAPPVRAPAACAPPRASSPIERTCPTCHGRGQTIADPCVEVPRSGPRHRRTRSTLGQHPRRHRGRHPHPPLRPPARPACAAARPAISTSFLSVKPHEFYQRDGADLYCSVPISMTTAALGGKFDVATLDGTKSRVSVPEGTQAGKQFRLKGKGMPVLRSRPGRRSLYPDPDRNAAEAHQAPARACCASSKNCPPRTTIRNPPAFSPA